MKYILFFTQLRRRIKKMCTSVSHIYNNEGKSMINLGVDSSGLVISKRGNYIEDKSGRKSV